MTIRQYFCTLAASIGRTQGVHLASSVVDFVNNVFVGRFDNETLVEEKVKAKVPDDRAIRTNGEQSRTLRHAESLQDTSHIGINRLAMVG